MKKEGGYVISVLGIVIMAVGFGMVPLDWGILNFIDSNYVAGSGILWIMFGVCVALK